MYYSETWCIVYYVGNTYKTKYVEARSPQSALKKARVNKSVVDMFIVDKYHNRIWEGKEEQNG